MNHPPTPPSQITDATYDVSALARTVVSAWAMATVDKTVDNALQAGALLTGWSMLTGLERDPALDLAKATAGWADTHGPIVAAVVPF